MFTVVIGKVKKKCNFLMDYYKTDASTTGLFFFFAIRGVAFWLLFERM